VNGVRTRHHPPFPTIIFRVLLAKERGGCQQLYLLSRRKLNFILGRDYGWIYQLSDNTEKNIEILYRGIRRRCPCCGKGKLFSGYLKQNNQCEVCGEDFSDIRADDAPPWLTILITGHLLAPLVLYFVKNDPLPEVIELGLLVTAILICIGGILPFAKGFFIAAIWLTRRKRG